MPDIAISVARDFSTTPGLRYRWQSKYSGQEFREDHLLPKFRKLEQGSRLVVDLDGVVGYATSFLEESFGGLAREAGVKDVQQRVAFRCADEPELLPEIEKYIREAEQKRR